MKEKLRWRGGRCRRVVQSMCIVLSTMILAIGRCWASDASYSTGAYTIDREIYVPMRDGVRLSTDVYLPKGAAGRLPAVLVRSPHGKEQERSVLGSFLDTYLKEGYAVVLQDERGRFFSEGIFTNFLQGASTDGYDTVAWVLKQPWSNGKVGTIGCSSAAEQQLPMAASHPPGHAAMIAMSPGMGVGDVPGNETRGAFYRGGVPVWNIWPWWFANAARSERLLLPANSSEAQRVRLRNSYTMSGPRMLLGSLSSYADNPDFLGSGKLASLMHLPSRDLLRNAGGALSPFDQYLTWTPADPRWKEVEHIGAGAMPRVPALLVDNWHDDLGVGETTRLYKYLQDIGAPNQYLIVGAGPHCAVEFEATRSQLSLERLQAMAVENPDLKVSDVLGEIYDFADLKFGDLHVGDARYGGGDQGYAKLFLSWYDYWLKDKRNRVTEMPKVQLYIMNEGWVSGERWPLQETRFTEYFLRSDPAARFRQEAGVLARMPSGRGARSSYIYDPATPTPSRGGGMGGVNALDQRPIEARKDVLVYSTPPLTQSVRIAGPIEVVLYVSSTAKDTDFMVKLVDVYPDGTAINLAGDAFRVRYREGFDKKVLMQQGRVYKIVLKNMVTAIRFPQEHRIRLDIASSDFPLYERNLNTGGNNYDETAWVVAENSVHDGAQYPSRVILPVLPD